MDNSSPATATLFFFRPWESTLETLETSPAEGNFQQTLEEGDLNESEPALDRQLASSAHHPRSE